VALEPTFADTAGKVGYIGEWTEEGRSKSTHGRSDAVTFMRWPLQRSEFREGKLAQEFELQERCHARRGLDGSEHVSDPHDAVS